MRVLSVIYAVLVASSVAALEATQARLQRADTLPLPSSMLTFPRAGARNKEYLTKRVMKDRVPGGYATFVAHMYTAKDPLHHFSVLQPMRGCGSLDTPSSTADANGGCDVATNGGFFIPGDDVTDHKCIGPIVSDGYWRHKEHRNNVMFGIRAPREGDTNTTYFFGYMDPETMSSTRWLQLLSGVVWLVRDGKVNVQDSMKYENFTAQRSGDGEHFRTLKAPRLSVGVNGAGELMLLAVDGSEPDWEGLSLDDVAKILVAMGAVQAINLDGGGSVSVFEGDDIVNIPSDVCPETTFPKYRCARKVSSVLCLHPYSSPKITRTATRYRSQTVLPSFTTFSMSLSRHDDDISAWSPAEALQRGVMVVAKVIIPLALGMWVVWLLWSRWKKCRTNVGALDRIRLADADSSSEDSSDIGGDVAVNPDVELRPEPSEQKTQRAEAE